jgi:hypothetical protein
MLDSRDPDVRAQAVSALGTLDVSILPQATRTKLIGLLESDAASPLPERPDDSGDSAKGEERIQLVRLVTRLGDARAARGLALGGIAVSEAAQRLVASQGDAALPLLLESERVDTTNRSSAAMTRALMLGEYGSRLSAAGRLEATAEIFRVASVDGPTFADAAEIARLLSSVPVLEQLAAAEEPGIVKSVLVRELGLLSDLRARSSVSAVLSDLTQSVAAICDGAQGARLGACQAITTNLATAANHLAEGRTTPLRNVMNSIAQRASDAARQGAFAAWEGTLVSGTAAYLAAR